MNKEQYKKVNKKNYSLFTRIYMCEKYNPVFYWTVYLVYIFFISIVSSLLVVILAVK